MNPIRLRLVSGDDSAVDHLRRQLTGLGYQLRSPLGEAAGCPEWELGSPPSRHDPPPADSAVLEAVLSQMDDPVVACTRDGTLWLANPPARELFPEATPGTSLPEAPGILPLYREDGRTALGIEELPLIRALHQGPTEAQKVVARDASDTSHILAARARPVAADAGPSLGSVMVMRDCTDQQCSEQQLRRQRDLYAALSEVNQFVVLQEPDPKAVFTAVCEIAVTYGGLRLAWVGTPDAEGWVRPAAASGDASDYLEYLAIATDPQRPESHGPTGVAMREARHVVEPDIITDPAMSPWHAAAGAAGLRSSAAFPIHRGGEVVASLNVYAGEAGFFSDDLVHLLDELVLDISFALDHHDRMAERRRLAEILEATPDFVGMADPEGHLLYHNPAARELLGQERLEGSIAQAHPPSSLARLAQEGFPTAREQGVWRGETQFRNAQGDLVPFSQTIIAHRDSRGELTHFSTIARDLSEQKQAQAEIHRLAYRDTITGLPNRTSLKERLDQETSRARHQGTVGALVYLDLDGFKAINDSLGHPAGDALLQTLATRFREQLRPEDVVARVGGDEFVVLVADLGTQVEEAALGAEQIAKKLNAALRQPFQMGGNRLVATASVGITLFPEADTDRDTLLQQADAAMYSAKAEGPGNVRFYQPRMLETVRHRLDLEQDLRAALEHGQLALHYQPLVSLADDSVVGLEALLRWHHPRRGWVSPAEFIPAAEECGLILEVGDWVLQEAFRQLGLWREAGLWPGPLGLGINISPRQFAQPGFVERTAGMLEDSGIPGEWIKLEITENLLIQHLATAVDRMEALRRIGLSFAMDDFGTGYSSLAYLHQLPVTTLKIDRSLITEADSAHSSWVIVEAVLAMADRLGLSVVAEGVETRSQAAFLGERGCTAGQGFLWSPALAATELDDRLPPAP